MNIAICKENRVYYFDYLRVLACISVIFMHTAADTSANTWWYYISTSLTFVAVPLFLMMSGYLILSSEKTLDINVLLKKRIPRLLIPLGVWTIIASIWLTWKESGWSMKVFIMKLNSAMKEPTLNHFWFMYTIIAIYLISPILYGGVHMLSENAEKYIIGLILAVELYVAVLMVLPPNIAEILEIDVVNKLLIFEGHLCTFILGFFLGKMSKTISNKAMISIMFALLLIISIGTKYLSSINGTLIQRMQDQSRGLEIFFAAVVFLFFKRNFNKAGRKEFWRSLSTLSLPIYLMHNILRSIMNAIDVTAYDLKSVICLTMINLFLCFLTVKTMASIKFCCFLFTGITYKKACEVCNWQYTKRKVWGENNYKNE